MFLDLFLLVGCFFFNGCCIMGFLAPSNYHFGKICVGSFFSIRIMAEIAGQGGPIGLIKRRLKKLSHEKRARMVV